MRGFVYGLVAALALVVSAHAQGWPPRNGATLPASCSAGETFFLTASGTTKYHECTATNTWSSVADQATGGTGVPAGVIVLSLTSCPTGYEEETSLSGKFVLGTVAANDDVTDTGGSDSVTEVLDHTHPVTDPGHGHTQNSHNHTQDAHTHSFLPRSSTSGSVSSIVTGTLDTSSTISGNNQPHVQSATATNQAATATNQTNTTGVTTSNPVGGVSSIDNRPAFVKVIFCKKT